MAPAGRFQRGRRVLALLARQFILPSVRGHTIPAVGRQSPAQGGSNMQPIKTEYAAVEFCFPVVPSLVYHPQPSPLTAAALQAAGFMHLRSVGRWQHMASSFAEVIDALRKLIAIRPVPIRLRALDPVVIGRLRKELSSLRIIVPSELLPELAPAGARELLFPDPAELEKAVGPQPVVLTVRYEPSWLRPRPGSWPHTAEEREKLYAAARSLGYRVAPDGKIWVDGNNAECWHRLEVAVGSLLCLEQGAWDDDDEDASNRPRVFVDVFGTPMISDPDE